MPEILVADYNLKVAFYISNHCLLVYFKQQQTFYKILFKGSNLLCFYILAIFWGLRYKGFLVSIYDCMSFFKNTHIFIMQVTHIRCDNVLERHY